MSAELPEVGELVTVLTRLNLGERARVRDIDQSRRGSSRNAPPGRWWVRLESVDGSLYGAEGWYETHEFQRGEPS